MVEERVGVEAGHDLRLAEMGVDAHHGTESEPGALTLVVTGYRLVLVPPHLRVGGEESLTQRSQSGRRGGARKHRHAGARETLARKGFEIAPVLDVLLAGFTQQQPAAAVGVIELQDLRLGDGAESAETVRVEGVALGLNGAAVVRGHQ